MTSIEEHHCIGCGDSTQPGRRFILAKNKLLLSTWKEIFREKLIELNLEVDESSLLGLDDGTKSKGFICTSAKEHLRTTIRTKINC